MQKIISILFLGLILSSCATTRKTGNDSYVGSEDADKSSVIETVIKQNVTNYGFFIQKAEIEIINENESQKFIATIKFCPPDKFLFSLKSRTGIEGARLYLSKDSIMVNDRINKKMYFGSTFNLKQKYGIGTASFPVIFGDLVVDKRTEDGKDPCTNGILNLVSNVKGVNLNYTIDCKKRKIISVRTMSSGLENGIDVKFDNFKKFDKILVPRSIDLNEPALGMKIKIKIVKMEYPWNGTFKFISGKGYELIELL